MLTQHLYEPHQLFEQANILTVSMLTYLFLGQHLLDTHGLHGGKGLSPFQKALRDRRYFFSVKKIQNFRTKQETY